MIQKIRRKNRPLPHKSGRHKLKHTLPQVGEVVTVSRMTPLRQASSLKPLSDGLLTTLCTDQIGH